MNALERRAVGGLALVYWLRMLGLFMVLPVLAAYADDYAGATPMLVGLAVGIYGLTQALLQLPFGLASDRLGRLPVIIVGLGVFLLGSLLAASADSIEMLIAGRALQGAGAVAAAINTLLADLTRPAVRTTAMAILGISIGMAFLIALMIGPVFTAWLGLAGVFYLAAGFALVSMLVLWLMVPRPQRREPTGLLTGLRAAFADRRLHPLYGGIFVLHAAMTAVFVAVPVLLSRRLGVDAADQWSVFAPAMLLSILPLPVLIWLAERKGHQASVVLGCIVLAAVALVGMTQVGSTGAMLLALCLYFSGFNLLEASMPSLVSQAAQADARGAALGMYSTSQFLGAFAGGALGGWIMGGWGLDAVLIVAGGLLAAWLLFAPRTPWRIPAAASGRTG